MLKKVSALLKEVQAVLYLRLGVPEHELTLDLEQGHRVLDIWFI
jgi:hypothetical protein